DLCGGWAGPSAGPLSACCWGPGLPVLPGDPGVPAPGVGPCGSWIDDVTVGSEGTDQKASLVKNCPGSSTWYLASSSRCTLNRSSGYRRCSSSSSEISSCGLTMSG